MFTIFRVGGLAGVALAEADFVSMDTSGWTLNYPSVVPGTVRKAATLAIEAAA